MSVQALQAAQADDWKPIATPACTKATQFLSSFLPKPFRNGPRPDGNGGYYASAELVTVFQGDPLCDFWGRQYFNATNGERVYFVDVANDKGEKKRVYKDMNPEEYARYSVARDAIKQD